MPSPLAIGAHRVQRGDALTDLPELIASAGRMPDLVYTDPPWGPGLLSAFQTMAEKKDNTTVTRHSHREFLPAFLRECARWSPNIVVVEYGIQWAREVELAARDAGLELVRTLQTHYGRPERPQHIHIFAKGAHPPVSNALVEDVARLRKWRIVDRILREYVPPGGVVLDPCCGLGLTARAALENHLTFLGNELNGYRLGRTIATLQGRGDA